MINRSKIKLYNFLKWTEKWTKTDMIYLASGNFWLVGGRILSVGAGMFLTIAFANLLPPENFGTYKYILSLAGFLASFSLTGMGTAVTRAISQGYDGILKYSNYVSLKWGLVGSILSIVAAVYYFIQGNRIIAIPLLVLALMTPVSKIGSLSSSLLHGKKDFKRLTTYGVPRAIFSTLIMISVVFLTDNVIIVASAYFISSSILSLLTYFFALKKYKPNENNTSKEIEKETLKFSKHLSVMGFFTLAVAEIDKLLLFYYAGPVQLAVYTFASAPIKELKNLTENIFPLALPKFSNKEFSEIKKNIPFRIFQMTILSILIIALYIIFVPFLFRLLFPQYLYSIFYSQIFAITLLAQPAGFIETALTAHAKIKQKYTTTFTSSILKIFLFIVFIPKYGIWGIIFSIIISDFINYSVLLYILKKTN